MSSNAPTFEEVDKHIQSADLSVLRTSSAGGATAAAALPDICGAYAIVRPILELVSNVPILPKKWRDALKGFIQVVDSFCPQNP